MWVNLIIFFISFATLFILPVQYSLFFNFLFYTSILWFQYCFKAISITNFIIWLTFFFLSLVFYVFGIEDILPFTGITVYSMFAIYYFVLVINNFLFWRDNQNFLQKQLLNLTYFTISVVNVLLSFFLRPSFGYIYIPLFLFVISVLLKTRYEFFLRDYFNSNKNKKRDNTSNTFETTSFSLFSYTYGNYKIKEVSDDNELRLFNKTLQSVYEEIYLQMKQTVQIENLISREEFSSRIREKFNNSQNFALLLLYENEKAIGCLKVSFASPLPIENDLKINLSSVTKNFGQPAEIGRFAIFESHRGRPSLMETIFRALVHLCMSRNVIFLFCQGIDKTLALYKKIGFKELSLEGKPVSIVDREFGLASRVLYLNMAMKIGEIIKQRKSNSHNQEDISSINRIRDLYDEYCSNFANKLGLDHETKAKIMQMHQLPRSITKDFF